MRILGITHTKYEPSAALLEDGELVRYASEERFVRIKKATGLFPQLAVEYCADGKEIDAVAVGWDTFAYPQRVAAHLKTNQAKYPHDPSWDRELLNRYRPDNYLQKFTGLKPYFFPHHQSHAAASFFSSGFDDSISIVVDGHGEEHCATIFHGVEQLESIEIPHSLGWIYGTFVSYLGYERNLEEGTVMALAAKGNQNSGLRKLMEKIIILDNLYTTNPYYFAYGTKTNGVPNSLIEALAGHSHEDIAYALQKRFSQTLVHLTQRAFERTETRNVCLSGGVCLNCKMNGSLLNVVDNLFVQPASGDEGACIGAAMLLHKRLTGNNPKSPNTVYLGPNCGNPDPLHNEQLVNILADGGIIGRACGRMEMGPRALGNRSILASPLLPVRDKLNRLKGRQKFRPVCPLMTDRSASKYLVEQHPSDHMAIAFTATEHAKRVVPDIVHYDGSTRPQILREKHNPVLYDLLVKFGEKTGEEILINTSLNKRGDPIVCTVDDAMMAAYKLDLDAIQVGAKLCRLKF
jgi:carbamoyltransferase